MLVIVSWNVNSIRTREDHVLKLINDIKPDILMIQEIKCMDIEFPDFYSNAGYNAFICGEKGKYGVATLIKKEFDVEEVTINNQILKKEARLIMTKIKDLNLNLINVYTPNGNPIENSEKFNFKIEWMNQCSCLSTYPQDMAVKPQMITSDTVQETLGIEMNCHVAIFSCIPGESYSHPPHERLFHVGGS